MPIAIATMLSCHIEFNDLLLRKINLDTALQLIMAQYRLKLFTFLFSNSHLNPLDAGRRLTDFSQTSYAAGSRLTYKTVNQRSGS